jgi:hypothetical protein
MFTMGFHIANYYYNKIVIVNFLTCIQAKHGWVQRLWHEKRTTKYEDCGFRECHYLISALFHGSCIRTTIIRFLQQILFTLEVSLKGLSSFLSFLFYSLFSARSIVWARLLICCSHDPSIIIWWIRLTDLLLWICYISVCSNNFSLCLFVWFHT